MDSVDQEFVDECKIEILTVAGETELVLAPSTLEAGPVEDPAAHIEPGDDLHHLAAQLARLVQPPHPRQLGPGRGAHRVGQVRAAAVRLGDGALEPADPRLHGLAVEGLEILGEVGEDGEAVQQLALHHVLGVQQGRDAWG